ncbi:nuclease-related domain-containing DEAD/DEAH box helicase [Ruegeria conchae]|uniref:DNA 3'-5' helicase II n=1 Tax=Ruegeria conchae TaxID=981384 RepID=A0A497ZU19_9RHOB|nr:NERD domain-containing protein/DEAD/DEAH box helicase [Ruegeria conchae]RLK08426.1 hypothetical protein CLV75_2101 [Ruegeria conchae]
MVRLYPDYRGNYGEDIPSAEIKFYEACTSLEGEYHVFHSVGWISRSEGGARDGEADFLVCHPDRGFLVVEVKGGRIRADYTTGEWSSIDRNGREHKIKDPFRQSMTGKFNVLSKLREHRDWARLGLKKVSTGHAAFFPDVDDGRALKGPNAPTEIIGDRSDLANLGAWLEQAFNYWSSDDANSWTNPMGAGGIQLMQRIFARVVQTRPLLSAQIELEKSQRLRLTNRQIQTLDLLSRQRRVAISGGAGTGKTVLAVEKAKRLADEGFRTLLTCYNVPLASHLEDVCSGQENLDVFGFHKLCKRIVDEACRESGRDLIAEAKASFPGLDLWDHYFPIALAYALDIVDVRYDAIVVDEGQDFGEEYWLPIEMLLRDGNTSPLYVFHDENQDVYTRASTFPADASPITLSFNCRNTKKIHETAYQYYKGPLIDPPDLDGDNIEILAAPDLPKQAKKIQEFVSKLLTVEKIPSSSIVVLIADRMKRKDYESALHRVSLPSGLCWKGIENASKPGVTVETVARFKGLEGEVLVLWGLDELPRNERRGTLYVGISRAKSILALCGRDAICSDVLEGV